MCRLIWLSSILWSCLLSAESKEGKNSTTEQSTESMPPSSMDSGLSTMAKSVSKNSVQLIMSAEEEEKEIARLFPNGSRYVDLRQYEVPFVISAKTVRGIGIAAFCGSLFFALIPLFVLTILNRAPLSRNPPPIKMMEEEPTQGMTDDKDGDKNVNVETQNAAQPCNFMFSGNVKPDLGTVEVVGRK
ncbi:unnamed protein product [Toxocara canis]|uniref:DUF4808 domain-containing protein n=1 Tax=Toxocara canis TaxID=6265 RepID=A0A183VET4_TOXCA|nr:unnamed protein product [Toxocara canis]